MVDIRKSTNKRIEKLLRFYDLLSTSVDINTLSFIKSDSLDDELIEEYKNKYETMFEPISYNEFIKIIFLNYMPFLEDLD